ncbi:MAG: KOW motif-containing protein [Candidatus Diapherotrites archaeon]|nr:KOW motif-containing protein [Candidatus Diapherotrites archaeon]
MSRIAGKGIEKRLTSPRIMKIKRKTEPFSIKGKPGPHARNKSAPLGFVIRDLLNIASTLKEVKNILNNGKVQVNGQIEHSYRLPIGLFDMITVSELKKKYRMILDRKGRLETEEIDEKTGNEKYCKVIGKRMIHGKKMELTTDDGRTFPADNKISVGDTIKVQLPGQKIMKTIKMEKGKQAYVVSGKHAGKTVKILEVIQGTIQKEKLVSLQDGKNTLETLAENIIAIE